MIAFIFAIDLKPLVLNAHVVNIMYLTFLLGEHEAR